MRRGEKFFARILDSIPIFVKKKKVTVAPGKACELLQKPLADIEKGLKGPAKGNADSD